MYNFEKLSHAEYTLTSAEIDCPTAEHTAKRNYGCGTHTETVRSLVLLGGDFFIRYVPVSLLERTSLTGVSDEDVARYLNAA